MMYTYHKDGTVPEYAAIWVFGSNLSGRHGMGAALVAHEKFDAELGVGEGLTGRAYAIPTKDIRLSVMPRVLIAQSVKRFIEVAASMPKKVFFVTRVGCGLAGYKDEQIAPMFKGAPTNCNFPEEWRQYLE